MHIDVKVDLNIIAENIKSYGGKGVLLMVKSDGYGHGITAVAKHVESLVYGFGVATVEEGALLRKVGVKAPIMVCQWLPHEIGRAKLCKLVLSVGTFDGLEIAKASGIPVALKINTGMNRFGFDTEDLPLLKEKIGGVNVKWVYSHIYSTDSATEQYYLFERCKKALSVDCDNHILASSTARLFDGDIVRVGIGAYKGAMTVESVVVAVKRLGVGDNVGYGKTMAESGYIAWVFGGYNDGIDRENPQPILIDGKPRQVIAVCMDCIAVFTDDHKATVGEKAIFIGKDLTTDMVAQMTETIPYTILTRWKGRIKRTYIK